MGRWVQLSLTFGASAFSGFGLGALLGNSIGTLAANKALFEYYNKNNASADPAVAMNDFYSSYDKAWNTAVIVSTLAFCTVVTTGVAISNARSITIPKTLKTASKALAGVFISLFAGIALANSVSTKVAQDASRSFNHNHPGASLLKKMEAYTNAMNDSWLGTMIPCLILGTFLTLALTYREYKKAPEDSNEGEITPLMQSP